VRQSKRREEWIYSLGGVSSLELTAIQCKNIPDYLNDRAILEKHFSKIAKVQRVFTRRSKKLAVIHFFDHVSTPENLLPVAFSALQRITPRALSRRCKLRPSEPVFSVLNLVT
jgi:hypothetical protein